MAVPAISAILLLAASTPLPPSTIPASQNHTTIKRITVMGSLPAAGLRAAAYQPRGLFMDMND